MVLRDRRNLSRPRPHDHSRFTGRTRDRCNGEVGASGTPVGVVCRVRGEPTRDRCNRRALQLTPNRCLPLPIQRLTEVQRARVAQIVNELDLASPEITPRPRPARSQWTKYAPFLYSWTRHNTRVTSTDEPRTFTKRAHGRLEDGSISHQIASLGYTSEVRRMQAPSVSLTRCLSPRSKYAHVIRTPMQ